MKIEIFDDELNSALKDSPPIKGEILKGNLLNILKQLPNFHIPYGHGGFLDNNIRYLLETIQRLWNEKEELSEKIESIGKNCSDAWYLQKNP